ncbi:hypothetical protein [Parabacteroides sp. PF5-9]|uniref:hypothetical protein n=1 Tax=Parabacteroides sp. PF5-9 TaxID=1742404 RepID=UPI002474E254|nr:hypothetical protein [Parabacteroides sp. PF5-9]MDH6358954.1 hypothetical protein [Parabacteroides sp. PF5-9]
MKIEHLYIHEDSPSTMKFIESKRNWDVKNQCYRRPEAVNCKAPLSNCKIYWRGEYLILEYDDIIHFWEHDGAYCYLKQAVELMQLDNLPKWKTLDKLISLREGVRQTEVNLCGYVDDILIGKKMSLRLYREFMRLARQQDLGHHGQYTF